MLCCLYQDKVRDRNGIWMEGKHTKNVAKEEWRECACVHVIKNEWRLHKNTSSTYMKLLSPWIIKIVTFDSQRKKIHMTNTPPMYNFTLLSLLLLWYILLIIIQQQKNQCNNIRGYDLTINKFPILLKIMMDHEI
jgi:hypothetical protein